MGCVQRPRLDGQSSDCKTSSGGRERGWSGCAVLDGHCIFRGHREAVFAVYVALFRCWVCCNSWGGGRPEAAGSETDTDTHGASQLSTVASYRATERCRLLGPQMHSGRGRYADWLRCSFWRLSQQDCCSCWRSVHSHRHRRRSRHTMRNRLYLSSRCPLWCLACDAGPSSSTSSCPDAGSV